jgi:hypothetical protein
VTGSPDPAQADVAGLVPEAAATTIIGESDTLSDWTLSDPGSTPGWLARGSVLPSEPQTEAAPWSDFDLRVDAPLYGPPGVGTDGVAARTDALSMEDQLAAFVSLSGGAFWPQGLFDGMTGAEATPREATPAKEPPADPPGVQDPGADK